MTESNVCAPGSFTKNLGLEVLGRTGLERLHRDIRLGFDGVVAPVPRKVFRDRTKAEIADRQLVLLNFFLYNDQSGGTDIVPPDELVRLAVQEEYSIAFTRTALLALHLARVGFRKGNVGHAHGGAYLGDYARERMWREGRWRVEALKKSAIQTFLGERIRHKHGSDTLRKATNNYSFLLQHSGFIFETDAIDPRFASWVKNALFLALDRFALDARPFVLTRAQYVAEAQRSELHKLLGCTEAEMLTHLCEAIAAYQDEGGLLRLS